MGGKVRRLRVDVVEGEAELVLVHDLRGDLLADDLAKDGVAALGGIQGGIHGGRDTAMVSPPCAEGAPVLTCVRWLHGSCVAPVQL